MSWFLKKKKMFLNSKNRWNIFNIKRLTQSTEDHIQLHRLRGPKSRVLRVEKKTAASKWGYIWLAVNRVKLCGTSNILQKKTFSETPHRAGCFSWQESIAPPIGDKLQDVVSNSQMGFHLPFWLYSIFRVQRFGEWKGETYMIVELW